MQALALDTNAAVKKLEKGGLTRVQADAIIGVIQDIDTSALATKQDLDKLAIRLIVWFTGALFAQAAFVITVLQYLQ